MTQNEVGFLVFQGVTVAVIIGGILLLVWNRRRGVRLRAAAEARGEVLPKRTGLRIASAVVGLFILVTSILFLRH